MSTGNLKLLFALLLGCLACFANARWLRGTRDLALAMNIIDQVYVESTEDDRLYQAAMSGMLQSLDTNSSYISEDQLQSFQSLFEQEFAGLGVGLDGPPRRPHLTVVTTIFNSPAYRAGLRPGDVIARVDGEDVRHRTTEEMTKTLRGRVGASVTMEVERDGEVFERTLVRERIEIESVIGDRRREDGSWDFLMQADSRIAYVRIELFGEKTAAELRTAIEQCHPKPEGLIIDLRDNTGGLLLAASEICDMFLEDGQIVTTRGRDQIIEDEILAQPGSILPERTPIAILINEYSASASEIVAGCLKDRGRATIVGTRSFGKGSVQNVIPLEGGRAAMRLTTAYYYPPSGRRIHRVNPQSPDGDWGIEPSQDCTIRLSDDELEKTIERFRQRSQPQDSTDSTEGMSTGGDPGLAVDAQLLRAFEIVERSLASPNAAVEASEAKAN